jgi:hypothetical protein
MSYWPSISHLTGYLNPATYINSQNHLNGISQELYQTVRCWQKKVSKELCHIQPDYQKKLQLLFDRVLGKLKDEEVVNSSVYEIKDVFGNLIQKLALRENNLSAEADSMIHNIHKLLDKMGLPSSAYTVEGYLEGLDNYQQKNIPMQTWLINEMMHKKNHDINCPYFDTCMLDNAVIYDHSKDNAGSQKMNEQTLQLLRSATQRVFGKELSPGVLNYMRTVPLDTMYQQMRDQFENKRLGAEVVGESRLELEISTESRQEMTICHKTAFKVGLRVPRNRNPNEFEEKKWFAMERKTKFCKHSKKSWHDSWATITHTILPIYRNSEMQLSLQRDSDSYWNYVFKPTEWIKNSAYFFR